MSNSGVQFQKLEIVLRDFGDEGKADAAPGLFAGEELGAGGFVQAAHAPPEINFPRGVEHGFEGTGGGAVARRIGTAGIGVLAAVTVDIVADVREELGIGPAWARARACSTRAAAMRMS
jgi:hypothetical protein